MNSFRNASLGVFAVGAAIILFEIALTRVFAVMMWHHFTYMVVSIALLGFGAAGSVLTMIGATPRRPGRRLAFLSSAFALAMVASLYFGSVIKLDTLRLVGGGDTPGTLAERFEGIIALLLYYLVLSVPLFLGGLVIGTALQVHAQRVHRLYFADLVGSALGALIAVVALDHLGAVAVVHLAAALAALGGLAFARDAGIMSKLASVAMILLMTTAALGFSGGVSALGLPALEWALPIGPGKEMAAFDQKLVERRLPSATAEVEVTSNVATLPFMGGEYDLAAVREIEGRIVAQDGTAPTMLFAAAADLARFDFLDDSQAGSGYVALKAAGKPRPETLVVGVGGGVDVMTALAQGASSVTAVEINRAMIRMVTEDYDGYLGGLFTRSEPPFDRVKLVLGEGRSYVRNSAQKFDLIQLSGVDSFTALNTGAYTLSESYLYTVEAVRDFIDHLNDGGVVNYSRFILARPRLPRETLRLAAIARQALEEAGVADPSSCICVLQGRRWASTMIKKGPFTATEIDALRTFAAQRGFRGLVFDPLHESGAPFADEAPPVSALALYFRDAIRGQAHQLFPQPADAAAGRLLAEQALARFRGETPDLTKLDAILAELPQDIREAARSFFMGLLGDSISEVAKDAENFRLTREDFSRLLRSAPAEREAFIDSYPYRLAPSRDDDPFFFNYYKWGSLFAANDGAKTNTYNPDFPVGHAVLLASLFQVTILALVFILLPLRGLRDRNEVVAGKWGYLVYFSALGLGFMMVEISLMQKLALLLGHPTHALAVVLGGLLAAAGLGSFLSERLGSISRVKILVLGISVVAAIVGAGEVVTRFMPALLGLDFGLRVTAALALILPLGLLMGAAFPSGIRALRSRSPALIPWAWAVNGFTSVMGSILAIVMAQEIGFARVIMTAAALYAIGFLALPAESATADVEEPGEADEGHAQ